MSWLLSIAGVLGVGGLGAAAYLLGPAALLGVGRKALAFLARLPWQVYVVAALAALLVFLFVSRSHWIDRAHGDEAQLTLICTATRDASANPKLDCRQVPAQIRELGNSVRNLEAALAHQNAAIAALAAKSAEQQQMAADARKRAAERVSGAETVAQRLQESARHSPPPGAPCAPSKALQEQWQ